MRAVYYERFGELPELRSVPDPAPADAGVVIRVEATGLCRSDWHGWMGHDPDIALPHVPGHELAGVVAATGPRVGRWKEGDRVTLPFVCGCGECPQCESGNHQVCDNQFQPGFTGWGSFAEFVAIDYADVNLVRLPESMSFVAAASLGCRVATSFRAVVDQGRVQAGEWVAVHGCGGVGLSAIMIAHALGARVVAVDIDEAKLALARSMGAEATVLASRERAVGTGAGTTDSVRRDEAGGIHSSSGDVGPAPDVADAVREITRGGAHASIDALGSPQTCFSSVACLRKRGRHLQVGLMLAEQRHSAVPFDQIIANELEILGCHGIQAHRYPALLAMIEDGRLDPAKLIGRTIALEEAPAALADMDSFSGTGVTVIDRF